MFKDHFIALPCLKVFKGVDAFQPKAWINRNLLKSWLRWFDQEITLSNPNR